jgi:hypothetical protein
MLTGIPARGIISDIHKILINIGIPVAEMQAQSLSLPLPTREKRRAAIGRMRIGRPAVRLRIKRRGGVYIFASKIFLARNLPDISELFVFLHR